MGNGVDFVSGMGRQRYRQVVEAATGLVVGLDFDGTLAPIVADPATARIHPHAADVLAALAARIHAVAIVTGRPAAQALELGDLDRLGARVRAAGSTLYLIGQYGHERWSSAEPRVVSPPPPAALEAFRAALPGVLATALADRDASDTPYLEDKGLAVAVHTRRMADPEGAFAVLLPPLSDLAATHGLEVEPGRLVVEVRAGGMDKGRAVRELDELIRPRAWLFAGDDLGDLAAFRAVQRLRTTGTPGLLVCSGSEEETALVELADAVVPGPDGVLDLLDRLTADIDDS